MAFNIPCGISHTTTNTSVMKTISLGIFKMTAAMLVAFAQHIFLMMTGNLNFATPDPTLAKLKTAWEKLQAAIGAAVDGGKAAHQLKREAEEELKLVVSQMAAYVFNTTAGDANKILSAGFNLRGQSSPITVLGMPQALRALATEFTGLVSLKWDRVYGAVNYEVFVNTTDPTKEEGWTRVGVTSKSRLDVADLDNAKFYWFRVQAQGRRGLLSPMSDVLRALAA